MSVLDGLAPYFYDRMVSFAEYFPKEALVVLDEPNRLWEEAQAIEKEFRESMTNRLEKKGMSLPGQMNLLCESQTASEKLQKHRRMGLCMLEAAGYSGILRSISASMYAVSTPTTTALNFW